MLIYHYKDDIAIGALVKVPLKSTIKDAIILEIVQKPDFETSEILEITSYYYTLKQLEIAKFISMYYFSSILEAISLFVPHTKGIGIEQNFLVTKKKETIKRVSIEEICEVYEEKNLSPLPILSASQQKALNELQKHQRSLLFGVTGSGKTEIFIHLIADTISKGKNVILLMPEISLTPQMKQRVTKYFGKTVVLWHSKLSKKQKSDILDKIYSGKARIVAGARSALFTPLKNVGLIIVDEEHDDSYKAMTKPRYHARDVAVMMGKKLNAKVILASATPSLGSYINYPVVRLKEAYIKSHKRYKFIKGDNINNDIIDVIDKTTKAGQQAIIFLPTRGNFKYLYCSSCGDIHKCPFCSVGMAVHRDNRHLRCHYCGYSEPIITKCPKCGYEPLSSNRIGTKEVALIIGENLPNVRLAQFDKDSITTPKKLSLLLEALSKKEIDLLVGTQMISKGHDYPDITLSIIMGIDYILGLCDFRAKERACALIHQIAGRSGRAKDALVIIQTEHKEQFESYLSDYELFIKDELEFRKKAFYPPFSRIARIIVENRDNKKAKDLLSSIGKKMREFNKIEIVGEGKAPIEKIANKYRYHIIVKSSSQKELLKALHSINSVGVKIDMDAIDFS